MQHQYVVRTVATPFRSEHCDIRGNDENQSQSCSGKFNVSN